ncbi:hypothetical protein LguiB_004085 [Lonicera macranthoides]
MGSSQFPCTVMFIFSIGLSALYQCSAIEVDKNQTAWLYVNASQASARNIPKTLFGVFFEEINHAGVGGLWAELVSNRVMKAHGILMPGFEAGGQNTPSNVDPWSIVGNESLLSVSTDHSSCFDRNKVALHMEVHCNTSGTNICPDGGVGIYNPGFWGMNIEQEKTYKVVLYMRSLGPINVSVSLTDSKGLQTLATDSILDAEVSNWTKVELLLKAKGTNHNSRLQLTTFRKGVIWFDQVSMMPLDTYKGHGFRNDLFKMLADLKPGFIRFPVKYNFLVCYKLVAVSLKVVGYEMLFDGKKLLDHGKRGLDILVMFGNTGLMMDLAILSFSRRISKNYIGVQYDDYENLAEDLGALPIWVFNNGISHNDQVDPSSVLPFVQEILDGIEFARGDSDSTWGSVRADMGHPEPFDLRYVAIGNEDCGKKNYRGNYLKFYYAIKRAYPDIKIISNCDGSYKKLDHPADLYDFHVYKGANNMFSLAHNFDHTSRYGPKAFVSEYAVTGKDAGTGSLLAALAEAGFLIGLERNRWNPDAIVFNSSHLYGTPSYWMQLYFVESNGATLLNSTLNSPSSLMGSAITWLNPEDNKNYLRVKVVNFGNTTTNLKISIDGMELNSKQSINSAKTVLTSTNLMDENSFQQPQKVAPIKSTVEYEEKEMEVVLSPYSFTSLDLLTMPSNPSIAKSHLLHNSQK